jgi:hypothetical protein
MMKRVMQKRLERIWAKLLQPLRLLASARDPAAFESLSLLHLNPQSSVPTRGGAPEDPEPVLDDAGEPSSVPESLCVEVAERASTCEGPC